MSKHILLLLTALGPMLAVTGAEPNAATFQESFLGWERALVLKGGDSRTAILPWPGGRIISHALNGDSILWVDTNQVGRAVDPAAVDPLGGAVTELYTDRGLLPEMPQWLAGAWAWQALGPSSVKLQAPAEATSGIHLEKEVMLAPDTGELGLEHSMSNTSSSAQQCGLRSRALLKGAGFAVIPLGTKTRFKAGWALGRASEGGTLTWDGEKPSDPRVRVAKGLLLVRTDANPLHLATEGGPGWVIYTAGQLVLTRFHAGGGQGREVPVVIELGSVGGRAELSTSLRPLALKPGEKASLAEGWSLFDLDRSVVSFEAARDLAKRLPPSPFARRKD